MTENIATQEFVTAALATLELRIVREMGLVEERTMQHMETLKTAMAGNPETFAYLRAGLVDHNEKIEKLQESDKRWAGISMLVSSIIAGLGALIVGQRK